MTNSHPPSISTISGGCSPSLFSRVGMSWSDSGSSPVNLMVAPGGFSRMAFLALWTGMGHLRPITSTVIVSSDKLIPQFDHIEKNAIFTITNQDNLESNLKKFLFDESFQNTLQKNSDNYLTQFMANPGTASEKLASILKSY